MRGRPGNRAAFFVVARATRTHDCAVRALILLSLILAGCSSTNRTDGVTATEAAQLNAAAERLDAQAENATR
jgi:outer membrane murein-binding lipoprotein Lpp